MGALRQAPPAEGEQAASEEKREDDLRPPPPHRLLLFYFLEARIATQTKKRMVPTRKRLKASFSMPLISFSR
jgi:hypothetical protein